MLVSSTAVLTFCIDRYVEARWFRIDDLMKLAESDGARTKSAIGGKVPLSAGSEKTSRGVISTAALASVSSLVRGQVGSRLIVVVVVVVVVVVAMMMIWWR